MKRGDEYDKENKGSTYSEDADLLRTGGHDRLPSSFQKASNKSAHKRDKTAINYPLIKSAPRSVLLTGTDCKRPDHDVEAISPLEEEDYTSHSSFHSGSSPAGKSADVSGVYPTVNSR